MSIAACSDSPPAKYSVGDVVCLDKIGGELLITWSKELNGRWHYHTKSSSGQEPEVFEEFLVRCGK